MKVVQQILPGGLAGFDDSGSPVWILPIGRVDMKGGNLSESEESDIAGQVCSPVSAGTRSWTTA